MDDITPASLELFKALVEDAPNWSGSPLISLDAKGKGNLTHLKKLGLLDTFLEDDGCSFAYFTAKGREYAASLGYNPEHLAV